MAAATLRPQMTAATEHGQAVLRLDDSKRKPSDSGSADIRDYMQNKRSRHGPAEEDGKMEIGGILVDDGYSDEIEYLTCGEEETDDARSQIVCSLDECEKLAEMRVICKNKYCLEWGWKYFCRTHLRAWECNSCGDDGWSESASAQDPPEEGEDQDLPDEDEEDEDNGLAQSLAVTTQASRSAEQEWHRVFQLVDSLLVSERLRRRLKWSASPNAGDHEQGESATSLLEGFPSGPPLLIANTPARAENVAKSVPQRSPPRKSSAIQTYHHSFAPNLTHHRSLASASHKRFWSSSSEPDNKRKARENFDEDIAQTRRRLEAGIEM